LLGRGCASFLARDTFGNRKVQGMSHIFAPIPYNADDCRQCVACDHICGDLRDETPIACPSCGPKGIWLDAVDWSTCDADAARFQPQRKVKNSPLICSRMRARGGVNFELLPSVRRPRYGAVVRRQIV
jgi:hypothetical protein